MQAIGITFGGHVAFVGSIALIGRALHLAIPWHEYFLYVPLIYIIGAVPVTPGGVGLIEKFYGLFFVGGPVGASGVLAMAMLARLMPVLWSLPGLAVALSGPRLPKSADLQANLGVTPAEEALEPEPPAAI